MFKVIQKHPSDEQIKAFGMRKVEEDDYTNYSVQFNTLSDAEKQKLAEDFALNSEVLNAKDKLTLSVTTSI